MTNKIVRANSAVLSSIASVRYTEQVNAGTDLRPGCVSSASIEVEVYGAQTDAITEGEALTYYQVDAESNETLIGTFYAETTIRTKEKYTFTAYDAASKLDVGFSARLAAIQDDFPMTLAALVGEACAVAGVTLSGTFPLASFSVQAFYADNITCRQVVSWAAEIACRFVRCNAAGSIIFDWYTTADDYRVYFTDGTSEDDETYVYYKMDGLQYENYTTTAISRVAVHPTDEESVAYVYPSGVSSGNTLDITNNLLLTGAEASDYQTVAQNIYTTMSALGTYRPAQISLFPFFNPFRAGQIVKVTDIQDVSFVTPVMSMTVTDSAAILGSTGSETFSDTSKSLQDELVSLADNIVRIKNLKVDRAEIGTAIIDTLEANGINADWLRSGSVRTNYVNCTGYTPEDCVPNENNETTLLTGQSVSDGWIVTNEWKNLSIGGGGSVRVRCNYVFQASGDDLTPFLGETMEISLETKSAIVLYGGEEWDDAEHDGYEVIWEEGDLSRINEISSYEDSTNRNPIYSFTTSFTVPSDATSYKVWLSITYMRRLVLSGENSGTVILGTDGLRINDFNVARNGTVTFGDGKVPAIGTLANLNTSEKGSLVGAINEVASSASGSGIELLDGTPIRAVVLSRADYNELVENDETEENVLYFPSDDV